MNPHANVRVLRPDADVQHGRSNTSRGAARCRGPRGSWRPSPATEATPALAAAKSRPGRDFVPANQDLHLLGARPMVQPQTVCSPYERSVGPVADQQLTPSPIDDSNCQQIIHQKFPQLTWTIPQAWSQLSSRVNTGPSDHVGHRDIARGHVEQASAV